MSPQNPKELAFSTLVLESERFHRRKVMHLSHKAQFTWWLSDQATGEHGPEAHPSLLSGHRGLSGQVHNPPGATLMMVPSFPWATSGQVKLICEKESGADATSRLQLYKAAKQEAKVSGSLQDGTDPLSKKSVVAAQTTHGAPFSCRRLGAAVSCQHAGALTSPHLPHLVALAAIQGSVSLQGPGGCGHKEPAGHRFVYYLAWKLEK
ncbi:Hypothetical protein SMAX5B_003948 [Scophthalmus maximus]|uniref:Uncharacterized protein n=1 Tax=Scophthalmus maximus TaxID=52904 RepID=A0A2U9AVA9_SCOMX|nr:Hypothetical protein SMAX5B_003948 [Scophthalmus maximus]